MYLGETLVSDHMCNSTQVRCGEEIITFVIAIKVVFLPFEAYRRGGGTGVAERHGGQYGHVSVHMLCRTRLSRIYCM